MPKTQYHGILVLLRCHNKVLLTVCLNENRLAMVLLTLTLALGDRDRWSLQVLCQCYLHNEFQAANGYNERPCTRNWNHHKCTFHSYRDKMFNITGVPCSSCWGLWLNIYLVNFDYSDNFRYSCINSSMLPSSWYMCFCKPPSSTKQIIKQKPKQAVLLSTR